MYTKNGKPLQVSGTTVYSRSGKVVGRIKGEKVFGTDGWYAGTIVGDRLVYRSTQSAALSTLIVLLDTLLLGLGSPEIRRKS